MNTKISSLRTFFLALAIAIKFCFVPNFLAPPDLILRLLKYFSYGPGQLPPQTTSGITNQLPTSNGTPRHENQSYTMLFPFVRAKENFSLKDTSQTF